MQSSSPAPFTNSESTTSNELSLNLGRRENQSESQCSQEETTSLEGIYTSIRFPVLILRRLKLNHISNPKASSSSASSSHCQDASFEYDVQLQSSCSAPSAASSSTNDNELSLILERRAKRSEPTCPQELPQEEGNTQPGNL